VIDPGRSRLERVDALVDTGASYTTLPASMLQRLGVEPDDRGEFQLADGTMGESDLGQTWVRIDGRTKMTVVLFGEEGSMPVIGAVTLEEFRLGVDPMGQRLIEVAGYRRRLFSRSDEPRKTNKPARRSDRLSPLFKDRSHAPR
jgi:predicted aspartyl protease